MLYSILVHAHSGLRWLVLAFLLASIVISFMKWQRRDDYTMNNNRLYLLTLIVTHTQLLIGLILYFLSPKVNFDFISDKIYRFYSIEHFAGMLIAVALITVGRSRSRRIAEATNKHRTVFIFFTSGLIVTLLSIPWPFRLPGATWF